MAEKPSDSENSTSLSEQAETAPDAEYGRHDEQSPPAGVESVGSGRGGTMYRDDDPARIGDNFISAKGLFDETQRELQGELERIDAMEDLEAREYAAQQFRRKRRELLKEKIKAVHQQMEAQLQLEFEKYEEMERDEVEETWRMEKRLQEREAERMREEQLQREREEAERRANKSKQDIENELREKFLQLAYPGQLFLQHSKGGLMKRKKREEKFVKITQNHEDKPYAITSGSGKNKAQIVLDNISQVTTGHNSPLFEDSSISEELCLSIHGAKNQILDLEAPDQETRDLWADGVKSLVGHLKKADGPSELPRRTSRLIRPSSVMPLDQLFQKTLETVLNRMELAQEPGRPDTTVAYPMQKLAPYLWDRCTSARIGWKDWHGWIRDEFKLLPAELPEPTPQKSQAAPGGAIPEEGETGESTLAVEHVKHTEALHSSDFGLDLEQIPGARP